MWLDVVKVIGAPLIAGFVAAYFSNQFSSRFSFERFRKEQWWQAKRDAYESITRILSDIVFSRWRELASIETGGEVVPPDAPKRDKELAWTLQEIASAGAYVVSERTVTEVEAILRLLAESDVSGDLHGDLEKEYDAAKQALTVIRLEAYRELGIQSHGRR